MPLHGQRTTLLHIQAAQEPACAFSRPASQRSNESSDGGAPPGVRRWIREMLKQSHLPQLCVTTPMLQSALPGTLAICIDLPGGRLPVPAFRRSSHTHLCMPRLASVQPRGML